MAPVLVLPVDWTLTPPAPVFEIVPKTETSPYALFKSDACVDEPTILTPVTAEIVPAEVEPIALPVVVVLFITTLLALDEIAAA